MRLTAIIILSTTLTAAATGHSQTVTLDLKKAPVQKVFKEVMRQTGVSIVYTEAFFKDLPPVNIKVKNASVTEVMNRVLENSRLSYTIAGSTIVIKEKPTMPDVTLSLAKSDMPPPIDIHGRVTNENGEPVAGASVKVKGTDMGTSTNDNGEFVLNVPIPDMILVISGVNIETTEVPINERTNLVANVKMKMSSMGEVVINKGYYKTNRITEVGDVSSVTSLDIQKQPIDNPLLALQGRIPGMLISQQTGVPGGAIKVKIRGTNSIINGSDPLFVIDGVPYSSSLLPNTGLNIVSTGNPLAYINSLDIESIDVLKDADATAIYGSRGANGVVLISTKKGKSGEVRVNASFYQGVGKVAHKLDLLNTTQYLQMRREAFSNDNATVGNGDYDLNGTWDTSRYTDWQKLLIGGTAKYTNSQISVSGGSENVQYLIGGNYYKESTVFPGDFSDKKIGSHFSISGNSPNKKFGISLTGNYVNDNNNLLKSDLTPYIFLTPNAPAIYNGDGSLNWQLNSAGTATTWSNPFAELLRKYESRVNNLVSSAILKYNLLPNLELKASTGFTKMQVNEFSAQPIASLPAISPIKTGTSFFVNNSIQTWIFEPQLNYDKRLGKAKLNILLGATIQKNDNEGQILTAEGYSSDLLLHDIRSASKITPFSSTINQYKYNALFTRINYNWQEKYILNVTGRRDGSSRFGPDKQFHNFMAVGGAWVFSKEHYIAQNCPFVSFGKIRISYGTTGNDQIGDYSYYDLYNSTSNPYQGTQGLFPAGLFNPDLAWEETRKFEAGLELGFINDRILLTGSYYDNRSNNQLLRAPLPAMTGFTFIVQNLPALISNRGWEVVANTRNLVNRNFSWDSKFNITIERNKLLRFPGLATSGFQNIYFVNQPLGSQKVYHFAGIDTQTGVFKFSDSSKNSVFVPNSASDRNTFINFYPTYYGGLENSFRYKDFTLDFFFQFTKQTGQNFLVNPNYVPGVFGYVDNQPASVLDRWRKPGDITDIQKFTQSTSSSSSTGYRYALGTVGVPGTASDYVLTDASFIRLKNASISYSFPQPLRSRAHLKTFRIYLQGQNLFTITKYKGLDPETQSISSLPPLRIIVLGLQIGL